MGEALYLDDCYLREFEATVAEVNNEKYVVLDRTAFYYNSGGQPYDTGKLVCNGEGYKVVYVGKFGGKISHEVDKPGLKPGDKVHGTIDWERRYKLMRTHTAAHIVSAIFHKEAGALITGGQLGLDKSRIDFSLEDFDREKIDDYIRQSNEIVEKDLPIKIYSITRAEAEAEPGIAKLAKGLPEGVQEIRIVEITDFDRQADGGTHIKSTKEVGEIVFVRADNKGKNNRRVYYKLAE